MLSFAGLFALLTAGKGVKQFVSDITAGDAALGRFAGTVGASSKTIQGWQGAVESIGGSAADTATDIRMLSDQLQGLALSGDSSKLATIGKIQALSGKRINLQANPAEQLEQYNVALHALYQKNPAAEGYLSRQLGITDADNQLLIMAPERVKKLRQEFEKFAASDQDIQAAEKRQDLWAILIKQSSSLGRSILTMLTPAILQVGAAIRDFMNKHGEDLKNWFADVGQAILNAPWKEWLDDIKSIATDIDWAVKSTFGWKAALLGLLGVQVLNWLSPVVAAFGLLNGFLLSIVGAGPALAALFATGGALAGLAALYGLVRPTPLNEGEDELARQRRYGQGGSGAGAGAPSGAGEGSGGGGAEGGGIIRGAHAAESNRRPAHGENGTPWNHQTAGPPAETTKPYGNKMPSFDEFQKSLAAPNAATTPSDADKGAYQGPPGFSMRNKRVGFGERYDQAMRVAMDELRNQGVAEENLRAAAAIAVGNASAESELVPQTVHDRGTGDGIYGARDPANARSHSELRRTRMFEWLAANGYDRNSLVGQQRYMIIEAQQRGGAAWRALQNANEGNYLSGSRTFTAGFEAPAIVNDRRAQTREAYRHGAARAPVQTDDATPPAPAPASTPKLKDNMTTAEINAWNAAHGGAAADNAWQKALHTLSRPHEHAKKLLQHISANIPNVGAATASHVANHNNNSSTVHNNSAETHVGAVHVNMAPGSDASAIARDIKPALERVKYALNNNYGLA